MERICTRYVPPPAPPGLIERPRLGEMRADAAFRRLTLVRAPAGYGKTTLLIQWFEASRARGAPAAWASLDAGVRTREDLLACVTAMLGSEPPPQAAFGSLVDRLAEPGAPTRLFLDDVQTIGEAAAAALDDLIRKAPRRAHFVIATRDTRNLKLAAMRAYGELSEITEAELRFTRPEAQALLAAESLEPREVDALVTTTEGWVTGLKLALHNPRQGPDVAAVFSGRGRAVAAYFAEQVLAAQPDDVRRFLLETAPLDSLSPQLCNAVTGRCDSSAMLRRLEAAGLFIEPVDEAAGAGRYHRLFSEFLRGELSESEPGTLETLHRRAAHWLASQGDEANALAHAAQAGDPDLLASILEAVAEQFTYSGKLATVADYAARLPEAVLAASPWTLLALAWLKIRGLRYRESRRLLDMASAHLVQIQADPTLRGDDLEALQRVLDHRRMMLAAAQDDMPTVEVQCAELMRRFGSDRPYLTCTLHAQMITARREQFRFDGLERLHAQGRAIARESGYHFALVALQATAGASLFAAGRTDLAMEALTDGLKESRNWAGPNSGLAALAALPLADLAYEQNDLEAAAAYLDGHMPVARELSFADQLVAGHITRSRLHAARGDLAAVRRALDEAMGVALECDLTRLRLAVLHEQVRLLLRNGMPDAAARQASEADLPATPQACLPQPGTTTRDELRALIWVRMALGQGRVADALAVAKGWRSFCAHREAVRALVRWNVLVAQALMFEGDSRAAQRMMREAITAAAPAEMVRSFVDEGPFVLAILAEAYADSGLSRHPTDLFAQRVLEAFGDRRPAGTVAALAEEGLYGHLGAKELEILSLVGCGLRNREIGDRLGLSEGSVKWYMQQVYDKVGIRRRSQAVERARQFGLIA